MKLVLLFFCGILIFCLTLIILIALLQIRLNIKKCYISNIKEGRKQSKVEKEFLIYLEIYLLGFIKIAKIKITKNLINNLNIKPNKREIKKDVKIIKRNHPLEILKKLKIKLKKANLDLEFGTDSVMFTVYMTAIISSIIRNTIC